MHSGKKSTIWMLGTLLCLLTMLLAACGSGSTGTTGGATPTATTASSKPAAAPKDKQILRYPVVGDITTTDPAQGQDTDSNTVISAVFTGLVALDDNLKLVDQMAASHQVSSDGLTYTFTLRPNLKFSDGTQITATDIAYSINRTIDPATNSDVAYYLAQIKDYDKFQAKKLTTLIGDSLIVSDPLTLKIIISSPAAFFLKALSYPCSYVVEKSLVTKYGTKYFTDHMAEGGSSGPFVVKSYDHNTGIDLVPNTYYYGPAPQLQDYKIVFYKDQDGMFKAYQAGQLDYAPIPPAELANNRSTAGFREVPQLTVRYISFNYLSKPFDNIKIRQAFAVAVNKDVMVQTALRGAFTPTNHIVPFGMEGYAKDLKGPGGTASTAGDKTKAAQLLKDGMQEAGLTTLPPLTLTFYPRNQGFKDAITAVTQMWKTTLNVTVNVNIVTRSKLLDLENATQNHDGPLQIWVAGWQADYPDAQDWLSTFFAKGSNYNQFNYGQNNSSAATEQQAVQQELTQADTDQNNDHRQATYNDAEQKIINDVGWLPLWQEKIQALVATNVQGLVINAQDSVAPNDWGSTYISQ